MTNLFYGYVDDVLPLFAKNKQLFMAIVLMLIQRIGLQSD